jgi:signal transduction histidine kinase/ActR/RegA family two-component response regulator
LGGFAAIATALGLRVLASRPHRGAKGGDLDKRIERHMPMTTGDMRRRLGVAQVEALFDFIPIAALAAAAAAATLTAGLVSLGFVQPWIGAAWVCYIVACALANLSLRHFYGRSRSAHDRWHVWALGFAAINFAMGIGFGWAPLGLTIGSRLDVEFLTLLVTLCMAAGAVTAFGPYLPAFVPFFLSATAPFTVGSFFSSDSQFHSVAPFLMLIFIAGIGGLGFRANRAFEQLVRLQIRTEEMADDLERQRDIAESANLAKSRFLAAASHDLRQPVHALSLFVGALRGVAIPPAARPLIDQIEASITALDSLFGALLNISRLDAGVVAAERRPFAIQSALDSVCREYAHEARAKGIQLEWMDCAAIVDSDPVLVERILRNLVSNAVRYTERGRILVGCRQRRHAIALQVWDTGVGIPSDEQARVFEEYYQVDNLERDHTRGLGLGLAIVRRLAELLGCELTLRSQPGKGSCFEVALPLAKDPPIREQASPRDSNGALARGLIVIVDNEQAIRQATASLLTGWGFDVIAAASGDEAVERLSASPSRPDLVICDYRLRGEENGLHAIERLRSEYDQSIPAMLVTGDTAPDRLTEAQASGLLLLHKPVANSKLRAAIVNLIGSARRDRASNSNAEPVK